MAAALLEALGLAATLVKGGGGVFDVLADGELIYSKRRTGRFPEPAEVADLLRPRLPP